MIKAMPTAQSALPSWLAPIVGPIVVKFVSVNSGSFSSRLMRSLS